MSKLTMHTDMLCRYIVNQCKNVFARLVCFAALLLTIPSVQAHHSYADYDRDARDLLSGTITNVLWANPHIVITVLSAEQETRVEWITLRGADMTNVDQELFREGQLIRFVGSNNNNPDINIMTLVKEVEIPAYDWHWTSPSQLRN